MIDPTAATGFGALADAYERGRPGYPADAIKWLVQGLGIGRGRRVLDLGAGTGKLTRALLATGADLVAVEPVSAMRDQFVVALPGVEMLDGTAEAIPLPDASLDAVVVGQAFHWFDPGPALVEVCRVLRPDGGLGLIWNERDESVEWVAELSAIMHWDICMPYRKGTDWCGVVGESGRFVVERRRFRFDQELDEDGLVARVASTSYIAAVTEAERAPYLTATRALVAGFPSTFVLPHTTDAYLCRRTGTPQS